MKTSLYSYACVAVVGLTLFVINAFAAITTPTEISGCRLWLDASDSATITFTSGKISGWADKSGNNNDMAQTVPANQPTISSAARNGLNVISFSGADWLQGDAVLDEGDDSFTYFAVWNSRKNTGTQVICEQSKNPREDRRRAALAVVKETYGFVGQYCDAYTLVPHQTNIWKSSAMLFRDYAGNPVNVYDNSSFFSAGIFENNQTNHNLGADGFIIGAQLQYKNENLDGHIGEIIIFDCILADTDLRAIRYYLQEKWAIECGEQDYAHVYDFESGDIPAGWTRTGTTFDNQPTRNNNYNKTHEWYIRTYEGNKDGPTGTICSPEFVLSNNTLRAKLAGGYYWNNPATFCGISLEKKISATEWKAVRQSTGHNSNEMREIHWGLYDLVGETVRLKICDFSSSIWGQVVADDIRILDEEPVRNFSTDFPGTAIPDQLNYYWAVENPAPVVTNGSLVLSLDAKRDIWDSLNDGPQLTVNTIDNDYFDLETHITDFSTTDSGAVSATGLILHFNKIYSATATKVDPIMFCIKRDKINIQGPSIGDYYADFNYSGVTNIYLKIHGAKDKFTFFSSSNRVDWVNHARVTTQTEGKNLIKAGVFLKIWGNGTNAKATFEAFSYQATPNLSGTVIFVK